MFVSNVFKSTNAHVINSNIATRANTEHYNKKDVEPAHTRQLARVKMSSRSFIEVCIFSMLSFDFPFPFAGAILSGA
eukprot:3058726-Amphidinium_carterae.1